MNKDQIYMVFDVESVGLHGEGFAVGFVIVNGYGVEIQHALIGCDPDAAWGESTDRAWVDKHVLPLRLEISFETPKEVRDEFFKEWLNWKSQGALLAADCCWPVEARFLNQCIDDMPATRNWEGPYPLIDIGSILMAKGLDPLQKFPRKENELPEHNPLCDARQSARILVDNL